MRTLQQKRANAFISEALAANTDDCIVWPFGKVGKGYPVFTHTVRGRILGNKYICEMQHGVAPTEKHQAAHECGNKACINRRHIFWKTQSENSKDKVFQGAAKLSPAQIKEIRTSAMTQEQLARAYNISPAYAGAIRRGVYSGHV